MNCPQILVLIPYYFPGTRCGGPIQSIRNLAKRLSSEFSFKIVTTDRDLRSDTPYSEVPVDTWIQVDDAIVLYASPRNITTFRFLTTLRRTEYEILYLSSFFEPRFTIRTLILRYLGLIRRSPVVLAPRGEFSCGALKLKPWRKKVYQSFAKRVGLLRGVVFQASSAYEREDIVGALGKETPVVVAPDLPALFTDTPKSATPRERKVPGELRIATVGRINRMKNIHAALGYLKGANGIISYSIFGPLEDPLYLDECQKLADSLPKNIRVSFKGEVERSTLLATLPSYDLLLHPSLGENFAHAIVEAMLCGVPVLASDRTPWRGLETESAGWDLPLDSPDSFTTVINSCCSMADSTFQQLRDSAQRFGRRVLEGTSALAANRAMFEGLLGPR